MTSTATGPSANSIVPASTMPLISPSALLHAHLTQPTARRPSGRLPTEPRPIQLNVGSLTHANGSSLIKIGGTTIACGVRAEILPVTEIPSFRVTKSTSTPATTQTREREDGDEDRYNPIALHNLLVPNVALDTGCSPSHPPNTAPSVEAQSLSQRLLSLLHTSRLVRPSDLTISYAPPAESRDVELGITGDTQIKAYWVLYIDMICISHGGSLFDAAWLALYAALGDTILPKAWWDVDGEKVLCSPEVVEAKRLDLRGLPVPCGFGVFVPEKRVTGSEAESARQAKILVDLDGFEEGCCDETGCVTVDLAGEDVEVVRIEKAGGTVVGVEEVMQLVQLAGLRWRQYKTALEGALGGG